MPELLPVLLGLLGVLGVLLELPEPRLPLEPLLGEVDELLPAAPELDLLKYASHSEREICPSLFVSTDEKLGVEALLLELPRLPLEPLLLVPPDAALPPVEELPDVPPEAAGEEDDDPLLMPLPLLLPDELCPAATPDSANNAAAVAMLTNFRFNIGWIS